MTTPGGADIAELLRRLGGEALVREAEAAGLSPRAGRLKCPFEACAGKGETRERDAVIYAGGHPRVHCYACSTSGDLLDILQRTRGWSAQEALQHLGALPPPPPRPPPALRVVGASAPDDEGKLSPPEARRIWEALAVDDEAGRKYLEGRGLEAAPWLRFATEAHPDAGVKALARRGYRLAACLTDVVGNPRGAQVRLAREAMAKEAKVLSVKGSAPSRAFFGAPHLVEASPVVVVAEGLADTLAAQAWCAGHPEVAVVGAAGMGFLHRLAGELEAAGVPLAGKLFALLPQNDRPANKSRREFLRLKHGLEQLGAAVAMVATPAEYKDTAEWRRAHPEVPWPPPEAQRLMLPQPGDETPAEARQVLPPGCAVAIPARVTKEAYRQDFTTLCALLDDASVRESMGLRGEVQWCEMSWRVRVGGAPLVETDLSAVRLGLETQVRTSTGKPLRFDETDIAKALALLARRRTVHPVREWLNGLRRDGKHRIDTELPVALGHQPDDFAATLLRRWLVSAVARAMQPGCKVDTVLVLVGPQGAYKSTFFEALAGEYFTDAPVRTDDKDGKLVMRRAWVVEWAELDAMRRARDQESVKAFLSARVDLFRKPYGREVVEAPRHCVIVGTTNAVEFLHDATGNRRFWPVRAELLDVSWVREAREQLWAEAVALYRAGTQWWLTAEEEAQLGEVNRDYEAVDVWMDPVSDWLDENRFLTHVTTAQVLSQAVGIEEAGKLGTTDERRVATILRQLGWVGPVRVREGSTVRRVYQRPEERR